MDDYYGFGDLRPGMRVNVEGTFGDDGTLRAHAISIRDDGDCDEIAATIQSVDPASRTLRLLGATLHVPEDIEIKDPDKSLIRLGDLQPGMRIKTKGRMLEGLRFAPDKIKVKDFTPDAMDEVEGTLGGLDAGSRSFSLMGFRVWCDEDVEIEA